MSTSAKPGSGAPGNGPITGDFASNLILASRMITAAKTQSDMALAVMYTVAQKMTAVSISLFDNTTSVPQHRRVVALVTEYQIFEVDPAPRADLLPDRSQLETLQRGLAVIRDVAEVSATTRQELELLNITWMASFGLRNGDEVLGTLDIYHTQPAAFAAEEMDFYIVLADQIGVSVRNRRLLEQTQLSLEATQRLYETTRAILGAKDFRDVLGALRQQLAPDAHIISHLSVMYDPNDRIQEAIVDYTNHLNGEREMNIRFSSFMDKDGFTRLHDLWNGQPATILFIEDYENTGVGSPLLEFSRQNGVRSAVVIWARERGLVWEIITVGFAEPRVFDERERRQYEVLADQINIVLQTHRLLRETSQSASRLSQQIILLQTINQLTLTINSATDEKTLLDKSCRLMVETTGIDHCSIALLIPAETATQVMSEYPARGTLGVYHPFADNPLYEEMRHTHLPIVVTSLEQETRLPAASRHLFERLGIQSFWILPLIIQDKMVGSIGLNNYTPEKIITPEMVETTQSIAVQIGLGLQNIRLLEDAQHRATQLQRITTFSQSAQATVDLPTILEKMLAETALMLVHDEMSISLYDWARNGLRKVAERVKEANRVNLNDGEILSISGYISQVWDSQKLLHIADTHQLNEAVDPNSQMRSWLIAPIVTREGPLGLVTVGNIHPYAYAQTDVALFEQMVTQLAVALENATAYTQSQRMVRNESLLNVISSQLQSQMSIETLMDAAVTELGRAIGARQARIRLGRPDGSL